MKKSHYQIDSSPGKTAESLNCAKTPLLAPEAPGTDDDTVASSAKTREDVIADLT